MRRHAQQQMHMLRPYVPLQNLDVLRSTNLPNQVAQFLPHLTAEHRLAILRDEHEMVVKAINGMGRSTILPHAGHRIASLLKASPKGEGIHPSQSVTLRIND